VTLWWTVHAWRTPETLAGTRFATPGSDPGHTFSLLLPARHEEGVLAHTVLRMLESTHPDYEVVIIAGHDDPGTTAVAEQLTRQWPDRVRVVVDHHPTKNKPRALNSALPTCRGEIVGVFDAEDIVHPDLLHHVDHAFSTTGADVVQGGVQLVNYHSSWYSLRNCLEYFFYFRSRLHLHAEKGFIPLGGNTVFVRTDVLRAAGGWDGDCLAEDCDLGVRLSSRGRKVVVAYDSMIVTREETPDSLGALVKQRTRWNQGFLQVLAKGDWKQLPTVWHRLLALYTLSGPFLQAFSGVITPFGVVAAIWLELPAAVAMVTFLPLVPTLATLLFERVGLHDFGVQYGLRIRLTHYLLLVASAPVYPLVLSYAALRAVWRHLRGRTDWELTRHVGAHLGDAATAGPPPVAAQGPAVIPRRRGGAAVGRAAVPVPREPQPAAVDEVTA
jgi:glycosyltransferase XagB